MNSQDQTFKKRLFSISSVLNHKQKTIISIYLLVCLGFQTLEINGIKNPSSFFCHTTGRTRRVLKDLRGGAAAGWFGNSNDDRKDGDNHINNKRNDEKNRNPYFPPPPPPFPPPPPPPDGEMSPHQFRSPPPPPVLNSEDQDDDEQKNEDIIDSPQMEPMMYPPPYGYFNNQPMDPSSPYYYPPPPQQQHLQWQSEQQYLENPDEEYESLTAKVLNLTLEIQNYSNESAHQLLEIDSLTEEVATLSNQLAHEQALQKEMEHNSTLYYNRWKECEALIESVGEELEELKKQKEKWESLEIDLEKELEEKINQLEELAFAVEHIREKEELETEQRKSVTNKFTSVKVSPASKKSGFFSTLFNLLLMRSPSNTATLLTDDDTKTLNLTRTTLTMALTQTRHHVAELEHVIDTLNQNNTAIAEVVESRDALISELNNRVRVFEEDKLVLKAALRQLQREMKEEIGPAREKLELQLRDKREDIEHLQNTITSLEQTHQTQLMNLHTELADSKNELNDTKSEIYTIGLYVDKLEERLANFALSKREFLKEKEETKEEVVGILEDVQKERQKWEIEKGNLMQELESIKKQLKEKEEHSGLLEQRVLELESIEEQLKEKEDHSGLLEQRVLELESIKEQLQEKEEHSGLLEQRVLELESIKEQLKEREEHSGLLEQRVIELEKEKEEMLLSIESNVGDALSISEGDHNDPVDNGEISVTKDEEENILNVTEWEPSDTPIMSITESKENTTEVSDPILEETAEENSLQEPDVNNNDHSDESESESDDDQIRYDQEEDIGKDESESDDNQTQGGEEKDISEADFQSSEDFASKPTLPPPPLPDGISVNIVATSTTSDPPITSQQMKPKEASKNNDLPVPPPPPPQYLSNNTKTLPHPRPRPPPFRKVRKAFSSVTGMHGVFTPDYKERKRRRIEMLKKVEENKKNSENTLFAVTTNKMGQVTP